MWEKKKSELNFENYIYLNKKQKVSESENNAELDVQKKKTRANQI